MTTDATRSDRIRNLASVSCTPASDIAALQDLRAEERADAEAHFDYAVGLSAAARTERAHDY